MARDIRNIIKVKNIFQEVMKQLGEESEGTKILKFCLNQKEFEELHGSGSWTLKGGISG